MLQDDYREYRHYRVFQRRFLAQWIDHFLLRPVTWLHDLPLPHLAWPPVAALCYGILLYTPMLYSVLLHARSGQTVGKRLLGIRVLDVSGQRLRPGQAVRRDLVTGAWATWNLLSAWPFLVQGQEPVYLEGQLPTAALIAGWGMVGWAFLELLAMLANEKRRSLHDFIAGSVVVKRRKGEWRVSRPGRDTQGGSAGRQAPAAARRGRAGQGRPRYRAVRERAPPADGAAHVTPSRLGLYGRVVAPTP